MNRGFKKFLHGLADPFVATSLGIHYSSAKRKYKKYKTDPNSLSIEKRYGYVYKLVKRAVFCHNVEVFVSGLKYCPKVPALYICNHKSMLDGILMFKVLWENGDIPYFKIIAKGELGDSKIGSVMHLIDSVLINRQNIRDTAALFKEEIQPSLDKKSFVIFPEGTRIFNPEIFGEFHPGSFRIALDNYLPIVPVVIYGSSGTAIKENKEYLNKAKQIFISFLPPLKANQFMTTHAVSVAEEVKNIMWKEYKRIDEIVKKQPKKLVKDPHLVFEEIDNEKKKEKRK